MVPFDRSHMSSYSSSIVTMAVSCNVSEIKRYIGRKTQFFILPVLILHDLLEPNGISAHSFNTHCPSP